MKKMILTTLMLPFCLFTSLAQDTLTKQNLIDDFNLFIQYIEETHPDPYSAYGGQIEFKRVSQGLRDNLSEKTSLNQFHEILSGFMAKLEDGHTVINKQKEKNGLASKLLPISIGIAGDGIYIAKTSSEYKQYLGAQILSINDYPISKLLEKVKTLRSAENQYGAYDALTQLVISDKNADLLFDTNNTKSIKFTISQHADKKEEIDIPYIENPEWIHIKSKVKLTKENKLLYGQILKENKLSVGYFVWNSVTALEMDMAKKPELPSLYKTFSELLRTMKAEKSDYLIVDLRENSGGMTPLCLPVLYMLYGDKYLNFNSKAEYNVRFSPLLLSKWGVNSIEDYNSGNASNYILGDFRFGPFFGSTNNEQPIEEKRKNLSLISYFGGIGAEYTKELNGKPIHSPHVIVLTSPTTFSAAYHFMYLLTEIGNATVVGVSSKQAGNTFMETTNFQLPKTKTTGSISNAIQIFFPDDPIKGKNHTPDFSMNWSDYAKYHFDENAEILYTLDLIKAGKIN